MQPAGSRAHHSTNLSRAKARLVSTRPARSTACTWITRLARSTPTRTASRRDSPRVICSTGFPLQWLEIDDFAHHQSWRTVAVARRWEVPSHSHRADVPRAASRPLPRRSCRTLGPMPTYSWCCSSCGASNLARSASCTSCSCPAEATVAQIELHRARFVAAGGAPLPSASSALKPELSAAEVLGTPFLLALGVLPGSQSSPALSKPNVYVSLAWATAICLPVSIWGWSASFYLAHAGAAALPLFAPAVGVLFVFAVNGPLSGLPEWAVATLCLVAQLACYGAVVHMVRHTFRKRRAHGV